MHTDNTGESQTSALPISSRTVRNYESFVVRADSEMGHSRVDLSWVNAS